ncbi:MAG: hypothetical protein GX351_11830 [Peptococcaceae bacterium]|jgi:maltodextrin utilization protein YvdJ|nr:hypothetical protein [Peptococcaceae bacterium]
MDPISYSAGWFTVVQIFMVLFWVLVIVCLIQLFRFLTKGIKALDIYINNRNKED